MPVSTARTMLSLSLLLSVSVGTVWAARPSDSLLPDTAKGYVSVASVEQVKTSWKQTQLGQLLDDEMMKPFAEDLGEQLRSMWSGTLSDLGVKWEDLEKVSAGEVAGALIHPKNQKPGMVTLIDVTGKASETTELLKQIDEDLKKNGATATQQTLHETQVTLYEKRVKPKDDADAPDKIYRAAYFTKDDLLCVTSSIESAAEILKRFTGEHPDSLNKLGIYQTVMNRCRAASGDLAPQARWFAEPLGLAKAIRILRDAPAPEGTDMLKVIENQGFAALKSLGGHVNFAVGQYDLLHRTAAYAPKPYEKAMRMLVFPNGENLKPQSWVPADVATYITVNWDMKNAFEMASTLFDELFGEGEEGVFEDTLESIRTDPNGPGIDIRKDMIAHIGSRATMIVDLALPITTTSERMLFAADTTNEKALAVTIQKSMEGDPTVTRREFEGHTIWEITEQELPDEPTVELPGSDLPLGDLPTPPGGPEGEEKEEQKRLLGSSAICVAHGHIFVATHVELLERVLHQEPGQPSLADTVDYQLVSRELDKLAGGAHSMRVFRRTENEFRGTYELLKRGEMPEAKTMAGKMLNKVFGVTEGETREAKIDGSKLPDFEAVRRYLGPAGLVSVSEEDGWLVTGFTLNKEAP